MSGRSKTKPLDAKLVAKLNEGAELFRKGLADRAWTVVQKVLQKAPGNPDANHFGCVILLALNRPDQAVYHAERAVRGGPGQARYHTALGVALSSLNKNGQAAEAFRGALAIDPDDAEAVAGLGGALARTGDYAESEAQLERAMGLRADWGDPMLSLATLMTNTARADRAIPLLREVLKSQPDHLPTADQLALASSYTDALSPEEVLACHQEFGACCERIVRPIGPHQNTPNPDRKIRLAYLSSELRNHSNSFFLRSILANHDRERFEVVLYHASRFEDGVTKELKAYADRYVSCDQLTPPALAQRIYSDKIDILVELTGHFSRNRLATMAARPAPVQITYLGYGNTTGLSTIDARIIDGHTDPEPKADMLATEKLVRLDRCFLAFTPDADAPDPQEPSADRPFTFGSFNDFKKVSASTVRLWAGVLKACPDARLLIKTGELANDEARAMLGARFEAEGIDPERVTMRGRIESDRGHLALYDEVDCALDTVPYGGTTTTCQALWQGVPVVTLCGDTHAGRVGASLLHAVGRAEWTANDHAAFESIASAICSLGLRSRSDRLSLREAVRGSELMDHAGHTRALENVYIALWQNWCKTGRAR